MVPCWNWYTPLSYTKAKVSYFDTLFFEHVLVALQGLYEVSWVVSCLLGSSVLDPPCPLINHTPCSFYQFHASVFPTHDIRPSLKCENLVKFASGPKGKTKFKEHNVERGHQSFAGICILWHGSRCWPNLAAPMPWHCHWEPDLHPLTLGTRVKL